jgi:membrane protease YdiL (CAAX protease family)
MFLGLSSAAQTERATPSPYDPAVCTWALTIAKIAASAFVISIAEELFFRVWLVDFAGFWWMVALFAVEHGERWHVGALAGIAYGLIAKRFGIYSAIIAHATTILILGLWVVCCDRWEFW